MPHPQPADPPSSQPGTQTGTDSADQPAARPGGYLPGVISGYGEPIRIRPGLTWTPHHTWHTRSTQVDGQLSTGEQLDLCTHSDPTGRDVEIEARHVWLHGSVLTVCEDGAPDMIVLPVNDMSPAVIAEGIRRHLCQVGRSHPQAA